MAALFLAPLPPGDPKALQCPPPQQQAPLLQRYAAKVCRGVGYRGHYMRPTPVRGDLGLGYIHVSRNRFFGKRSRGSLGETFSPALSALTFMSS